MPVLKFGTEMGRWRGVPFCSSDYQSADPGTTGRGYYTFPDSGKRLYLGYLHQCVLGSRRALVQLYNITYQDVGMAYEIFSLEKFYHVSPSKDTSSGKDFEYKPIPAVRCLNGQMPDQSEARRVGFHRPVPGALLINTPQGFFKRTGHVAVVTEVVDYGDGTKYGVRIAECNVFDRSWHGRDYSRELPAEVLEDGSFLIHENTRGSEVLGWVAPISIVPPPQQPQPRPKQVEEEEFA